MKPWYFPRCLRFLAALGVTVATAACTPRATLPPPQTPLVPTPTAPFRAHLPPPSTAASHALPTIQDFSLPNGVRVLLVEREGAPLVTARVVSRRAGDEAGNPAGLALLTARALRDGTAAHDRGALGDLLADHGIELSAGLSPDASVLTARAVASELGSAIDLLAESVISPTFPPEWIDAEINTLVTARVEGGGLGTLSRELALASLFGPANPYGRPAEGFAQTLRTLSRDRVVAFHQSHFVPSETALVVVGGVTRAALEPAVTRAFGSWASHAPAPRPAAAMYAPHPGPRFVLVQSYGVPQSQIVVALRALPESSPDRLALELLASELGGMFSSRLNRLLREREGYTYGVHTSAREYRESGVLLIEFAVATEQTAQALREVAELLRQVRAGRLYERELIASRTLLREQSAAQFESDGAAVSALTDLFTYARPADDPATLESRIAAVTAEDVRRVAHAVLDLDAARIAVGGDRDEIESDLRGLGLGEIEVFVIDRQQ